MDRVCGNERDEGQINVKMFINFFCSSFRFVSFRFGVLCCVDHINTLFFASLPLSSVVCLPKICMWMAFNFFGDIFFSLALQFNDLDDTRCWVNVRLTFNMVDENGWLSHMLLWFCVVGVVDCPGGGYMTVYILYIRLRLAIRSPLTMLRRIKNFFDFVYFFFFFIKLRWTHEIHPWCDGRKKSNNAKLCSFNRVYFSSRH